VSEFAVAIQKLSEHCAFGNSLNDALRDRLVCGLLNETTQKKLLVEVDLTYESAKTIALAAETASKDAEELRKLPAVNKIKAKANRTPSAVSKKTDMFCTRCGKTNHDQSTCYFREKTCNKCSRKGHAYRMCETKNVNTNPVRDDKHKKSTVNMVETESNSDDDDYACLNHVESVGVNVNRIGTKLVNVSMMINGTLIDMEVDSSSPISIMPVKMFNRHFRSTLLAPDVKLSTFTGEQIEVCG